MTLGNPSLGLGEYLTLWTVIAVILIGVIGWLMGTGAGGALAFIILAAIAVLLIYAVLSRLWRLLLHGSITSNSSSGGDDTL